MDLINSWIAQACAAQTVVERVELEVATDHLPDCRIKCVSGCERTGCRWAPSHALVAHIHYAGHVPADLQVIL